MLEQTPFGVTSITEDRSRATEQSPPPAASGVEDGSRATSRPSPIVGGHQGAEASGLALQVEEGGFSLVVLGREGQSLLRLGTFAEEDVIAAWQSLGQASGLPLRVQTEAGDLLASIRQLGRVVLGAAPTPRRHRVLSGRRPRFLVRRKTGRFPRRPRVHREPEITGLGA
jgi:hypothetical protein